MDRIRLAVVQGERRAWSSGKDATERPETGIPFWLHA